MHVFIYLLVYSLNYIIYLLTNVYLKNFHAYVVVRRL